jgi:hypothetical protein
MHDEPRAKLMQSLIDLCLPVAAQHRPPRGPRELGETVTAVPGAVPWHIAKREQGQARPVPAYDLVQKHAADALPRLVGPHGDLLEVRMAVKLDHGGEGDWRVSRHENARAAGDRRLDRAGARREDYPSLGEHLVARKLNGGEPCQVRGPRGPHGGSHASSVRDRSRLLGFPSRADDTELCQFRTRIFA